MFEKKFALKGKYILFLTFTAKITFTTTEKQAVVGVAQQSEALNEVRPFTLPTII